jgi:hypothetical protein
VHRNGAHGTIEHFAKRDENVALNIVAALCCLWFSAAVSKSLGAEWRRSASLARAAAKKLFEEIAEPGALELEFVFSALRSMSGGPAS